MQKAMLVVKRRVKPMLAAIVVYYPDSGRKGRILVSEPVREDFTDVDLLAAARRMVPQVPEYQVILPVGIDL